MISVPRRYSDASARELRAFLSGTHPGHGRGSLPFRLAQRGPELLRLVAEFVLAPRALLYAGTEEGRVQVLDAVGEAGQYVPAGTLAEPLPLPPKPASPGQLSRPQSVCGLAADGGRWLVAATSCGCVRVFDLPSGEERGVVPLGALLPPRAALRVLGDVALVASRRELVLVDLSACAVLRRLALPFATRPALAVEGSRIFVQCDSAVRAWPRAIVGAAVSGPRAGQEQPADLWNPHRQMLTGMAVPPSGELVMTASPEEVRGWHWPDKQGQAASLLWALPLSSVIGGDTLWASTSLVCNLRSGGAMSLLMFGDHEGQLAFCEATLGESGTAVPGPITQVGSVASPPGNAHIVAQASEDPEVVLWSRASGCTTWARATDARVQQQQQQSDDGQESQQRGITALAAGFMVRATKGSRKVRGAGG